jgi:hypothetical protein
VIITGLDEICYDSREWTSEVVYNSKHLMFSTFLGTIANSILELRKMMMVKE